MKTIFKHIIYTLSLAAFTMSCDKGDEFGAPNLDVTIEDVSKNLEGKTFYVSELVSLTPLDLDGDGDANEWLIETETRNLESSDNCPYQKITFTGTSYILEDRCILGDVTPRKEIGDFKLEENTFVEFSENLHLTLQGLKIKQIKATTVYKSLEVGVCFLMKYVDQEDQDQLLKIVLEDVDFDQGSLSNEDTINKLIE